jgi:hypothetical protein
MKISQKDFAMRTDATDCFVISGVWQVHGS